MHRSARSPIFQVLLSHVLVVAVGLDGAVGCGGNNRSPDARTSPDLDKADTADLPDASTQPDSSLDGNESCSKYPTTTRIDSNGTTWYWWYLHWQSASTDLGAFCASYGAPASMVVEVAVPQNPSPTTPLPICTNEEIWKGGDHACAVAGSYRFEAPCGAGELLFELPSENTFNGHYHFESAQVPAAPRHIINQDVHCARDLYVTAPSPGPIALDAGAGIDSGDGGACTIAYTSPGCGDLARAECWQSNGEGIPGVGVYYCSCTGKTITGSVIGADEPYQLKGCCPGDSGFGPLGSYSCPTDGGLPFLTPKDAQADSPAPIAER